MLESITKLLKQLLQLLDETIEILLKLVQQKSPDGENFKFLKKYYETIHEINTGFQSESFNKEYVAKNIKDIFEKINNIFKEFGNKVVFIVEELKPKLIVNRMGKIITMFLQLLLYINTFIKNTSNGMIKETENKVKEISQNNNTQDNNNNQNKVNHEILIYDEDGTILNEGILDTVHGLLSSFGNTVANFGRLFYFKKVGVEKALNSSTEAIHGLNSAIRKSIADVGINDKYEVYRKIFASHDFAVAVGGTLTAIGLFFVLRRYYYKLKNYLSKKVENVKKWGKGENIEKEPYKYSYDEKEW